MRKEKMKEHTKNVLFSSKRIDCGTPLDFYTKLNNEFHFTTDPCTSNNNPLGCELFFTNEQDGLDCGKWSGNVFINPPYGLEVYNWVAEAYKYTYIYFTRSVVLLLPARTDTKWFHDFIWNDETNTTFSNVRIRFIRGRLKFRGEKNSAPFPSMVVIFGHEVQ